MFSAGADEMSRECSITIKNKTGIKGQEPLIADFVLFQAPPDPDERVYSAALKVDKLHFSRKVSHICLSPEVSFYVIEKDEENVFSRVRLHGPYQVTYGITLRVLQNQSTGIPEIRREPQPAAKNEIVAINDKRNTAKFEFALFRMVNYCDRHEDVKVVSYKNVFPGEQVSLAVNKAVYLSDVGSTSIAEGGEFKAASEIKLATKFELKDNQLGVTIGAFQKPNGEIYFREILKLCVEEFNTEAENIAEQEYWQTDAQNLNIDRENYAEMQKLQTLPVDLFVTNIKEKEKKLCCRNNSRNIRKSGKTCVHIIFTRRPLIEMTLV